VAVHLLGEGILRGDLCHHVLSRFMDSDDADIDGANFFIYFN
jgi:hypothetical protein